MDFPDLAIFKSTRFGVKEKFLSISIDDMGVVTLEICIWLTLP